MAKRVTADEFAERVSKFTNGRISIVKETYTGTHNRVTAYCNVHKIYFEVGAAYRLCVSGKRKKSNCPECIKEERKESNKLKIKLWSEVLKTFIEAYGNKFSYDESSYVDTKHKMKIHCNDCGEDFELSPVHHLKYNNGGCPNCHKYKIQICSECGKQIKVDRHCKITDDYICEDCLKDLREKLKKEKEVKRKQKNEKCEKSEKKVITQKKLDSLKKYIRKNKIGNCKICGRELVNGKCSNEFCIKYRNVNFNKLSKYFGFDETKLGTVYVEQEFQRIRDMIFDLYWNKHMSSLQLDKLFNIHTIHCYFRLFEIPRKPLSYAFRESISENRVKNPGENFIKGRSKSHITWENKEIFLRSTNEIKYAEYLDSQKILYSYESLKIEYFDTQRNNYRYAIPDFFLPDTNTIVEIKSYWTLNLINMLDKVKAYKENGYNFKLILDYKEVDIKNVLKTYKQSDSYFNHLDKSTKTKIYHKKWKWMNDGKEIYKVPVDEIQEYLEKGFVLGTLQPNKKK